MDCSVENCLSIMLALKQRSDMPFTHSPEHSEMYSGLRLRAGKREEEREKASRDEEMLWQKETGYR